MCGRFVGDGQSDTITNCPHVSAKLHVIAFLPLVLIMCLGVAPGGMPDHPDQYGAIAGQGDGEAGGEGILLGVNLTKVNCFSHGQRR